MNQLQGCITVAISTNLYIKKWRAFNIIFKLKFKNFVYSIEVVSTEKQFFKAVQWDTRQYPKSKFITNRKLIVHLCNRFKVTT